MSLALYRADEDKVELVEKYAGTYDIVYLMLKEDCKLHEDNLDISSGFSSDYKGLKQLYDLVKSELVFERDPKGTQVIRSPEFIWQHRNCMVSRSKYCNADCKSFSIVIASQLRRMKIDYYYRFVAWKDITPEQKKINLLPILEHVYIIAVLPSGQEVVMDATYEGGFDEQDSYVYNEDYPAGAMCQLTSQISGHRENRTNIFSLLKGIAKVAIGIFLLDKIILKNLR